MSWGNRFVELAHHIAKWSKDDSTQVGCVLVNPETKTVVATGFNGFPRGIDESIETGRWHRPIKYLYCEHAERNAIYNAARNGHATEGCHAYLNWNPDDSICVPCARAFIQAGIKEVYGVVRSPQNKALPGWRDECKTAAKMLEEAGIKLFVMPHCDVPMEEE